MPELDFEAWWMREGKYIDPDKRMGLAARAFAAGVAQSRNYVADEVDLPTSVAFANGRVVALSDTNNYLVIT